VRVVDRHEVQQLAGNGAQLVEVLDQAEFDWAHLPGAHHVPLREIDTGAQTLDPHRPVVVYCNDFL